MGKISLLVGAGIGYVLGTRAGREQYDKMAAEARKVWRDPRVQDKATRAQHAADDVAHRAQDKVTTTVEERLGNGSDDTGATSTPSDGTPPTGDLRA